jgi:hypothetical protein
MKLSEIDKFIKGKIKDVARKDKQKGLQLMSLYKKHWVEFLIKSKDLLSTETLGVSLVNPKGMEKQTKDLGESINEGKKRFKVGFNIGNAKYVISFHDGKSKHKDGSDFFGIETFRNQKDFEKGQNDLRKKGYIEESINEKTSPNEMYDDMMRTIKKSDEKKALQRLIDEFELGRVYYMFSTNRRGFFQAVLTAEALMKAKNLKEGRYHEWRNDESLTPKQKIGQSVKEIRDSLNELDKTIKMNLKLKTELNMSSQDYWKNTHKALTKISERLVKMANKVGNLK